jgi:hypothetical protein
MALSFDILRDFISLFEDVFVFMFHNLLLQ